MDRSLEDIKKILEEDILSPQEKLRERESQAQRSVFARQEEQVGARGKIPPGVNLSTKMQELFPMGEPISSDEDWDDNCSSEKSCIRQKIQLKAKKTGAASRESGPLIQREERRCVEKWLSFGPEQTRHITVWS